MLSITDLFERYTSGVAKTFVKLSVQEAEANRQTQEELKAQRQRADLLANPEQARAAEPATPAPKPASVAAVPPAQAEPAAPAEEAEAVNLAKNALDVIAGDREEKRAAAQKASAPRTPSLQDMPMGVRGEVVISWLTALFDADRKDIPHLIEKMRKDKKVRVPELQIICAEALGEAPQHRKKGDHLAALKTHFMPADRVRLAQPEPTAAHAS